MQMMHDLKDMLLSELEEIVQKGDLSAGSLDAIDKLTHSIKSIVTILAMEDSGYSYDWKKEDYRRDMRKYPERKYSRDEGKSRLMMQIEKLMDGASDHEKEVLQDAWNQLKSM